MSREVSVRCDEFASPAMVLLLPPDSDWHRGLSRGRQLKVNGLKGPVRVWLRPSHAAETLFDRFCRRHVEVPPIPPDEGREKREFMKRSVVTAAWDEWFKRWGEGVKPYGRLKLSRLCAERFGKPSKRQGHYGWKGFKFTP